MIRLLFYCRSLLNEMKQTVNTGMKSNVSASLIQQFEEHLVRCGIYEPFEKMYLKTSEEHLSIDFGCLLAIALISQLPRLQICNTTGK